METSMATSEKLIEFECPQEILLGLHLNARQFGDLIKQQSAIALFRESKLTSGMAARWLGSPRIHFLLNAMQQANISLLQDDSEDFARETSLIVRLASHVGESSR